MRDYSRQAEYALKAYLERGQRAVELLTADDIDGAGEVLRLRTAAFHNFRTADGLAQRHGVDVTQSEAIKALWSKLQEVESRLAQALAEAHEQTGRLYVKVRETRSKLGRYRSREEDSSRFEQSV